MLNFILQHFSSVIAGVVAGSLAVWVHTKWANVPNAYGKLSHVFQAAIGVVVAGALAVGGTDLESLAGGQDVLNACKLAADNTLTPDCLNSVGGLFSKENISVVIGLLITLVGHVNTAIKENTRITSIAAGIAPTPK